MRLVRFACLSLIAIALRAAPLERDLGEGLGYFRVHLAPADLPTNEALRKRPCVLDLRFAQAEPAAAAVLSGWLKFHAADKTPVFVLVNGGTDPAVLQALHDRDAIAGLLVIGIAAQKFAPDIAVIQSAADERRAYDALEKGTTVAALTTDNPDKQRNDEASLAHDRTTEPAAALDDEESPRAEKLPGAKPKGPPIDAALQRAIHLYRALRAMKRV